MKTILVDFTKHLDTLIWLHRHCFPSDVMPDWGTGTWWISFEEDKPIAFIGVEPVESWSKTLYIGRVGVVQTHRGKGIQGFLMRKVGIAAAGLYERIISSTCDNPASANTFIRCKYKTYMPEVPWGCPGTVYWIKEV